VEKAGASNICEIQEKDNVLSFIAGKIEILKKYSYKFVVVRCQL